MDFLVDNSENEELGLIRYISTKDKGACSVIYVFPIILQREYNVSIQTIRSVLTELEEKDYIEIIQRPNFNLTDAQRLKRDDEEDYYFIEVKDAYYNYANAKEMLADSLTPNSKADSFTNRLVKAELSFVSITVPCITVNGTSYFFSSMRLGRAFHIVSHCLEHYPNRNVTRHQLLEELEASGTPIHGTKNIKEELRNSIFGSKQVLSNFVVSSSNGVLVKPAIKLSADLLESIQKSSEKNSE